LFVDPVKAFFREEIAALRALLPPQVPVSEPINDIVRRWEEMTINELKREFVRACKEGVLPLRPERKSVYVELAYEHLGRS
jgi:hypothetical protein